MLLHLDDRLARAGHVRRAPAVSRSHRRARRPRSGRATRSRPRARWSPARSRSRRRGAAAPRAAASSGRSWTGSPSQSSRSNAMKIAGISADKLADAALGRMQPRLHRVEVEHAVARDHDLAVERGVGREQLAERRQLGEVAQERAAVARPERELAAVVLEHAAEPVPLRLVLPALAGGELADELRLHRREGDVRAGHVCKATAMGELDGEWEVRRVSGALPPLYGVHKRIDGCGRRDAARPAALAVRGRRARAAVRGPALPGPRRLGRAGRGRLVERRRALPRPPCSAVSRCAASAAD